jgi:hypothetical protein
MKWYTVRIERDADWGDPLDPTVIYTGLDAETAAQAFSGFREACKTARHQKSGLHCYMECRDAATGALLSRHHLALKAGRTEESKWVRHSAADWVAA